jgi:hypothetical protein
MHAQNKISISKVTHAGRMWSALTMRTFGTSVDGAKAIGQWSAAGSFGSCYDRELPLEGLLGAAMFNANKPEGHFLARDTLRKPFLSRFESAALVTNNQVLHQKSSRKSSHGSRSRRTHSRHVPQRIQKLGTSRYSHFWSYSGSFAPFWSRILRFFILSSPAASFFPSTRSILLPSATLLSAHRFKSLQQKRLPEPPSTTYRSIWLKRFAG